ncbi:hypothetical protein LTR78_003339 [Recurvomyces mirabilis]|uniref:Uncharacterized protein n=1 Tax=Recurvomyces mirabilis TaxID=574656 RepID=A0AAE1C3I1_9PEZI|nr:hypothetical protein LTR78_003339 [Recurvomyces mirabilis]KAK5154625.1 hypothetical protein LTS14_006763 [Recurvomyces mirabilis]
MASRHGFSLQCSLPTGKVLSAGEVDAWELKAARRGLKNLKTLLEGQAMLDLLTKQIEESDAYFKAIIAKSKGQFNESRIDFKAKGITSSQFLEWFKVIGGRQTTEGRRQFFLDTMAPAHPEHYALGPYPMGIIETIGLHVCRLRVDNAVEVPDFVKAYGDASYGKKLPVTGFLDDGTLFFYGFQELRDTDDGCDFRFRIIFPAAAPQDLFDEHTEHLAIEFRSWIATAFESYQK